MRRRPRLPLLRLPRLRLPPLCLPRPCRPRLRSLRRRLLRRRPRLLRLPLRCLPRRRLWLRPGRRLSPCRRLLCLLLPPLPRPRHRLPRRRPPRHRPPRHRLPHHRPPRRRPPRFRTAVRMRLRTTRRCPWRRPIGRIGPQRSWCRCRRRTCGPLCVPNRQPRRGRPATTSPEQSSRESRWRRGRCSGSSPTVTAAGRSSARCAAPRTRPGAHSAGSAATHWSRRRRRLGRGGGSRFGGRGAGRGCGGCSRCS